MMGELLRIHAEAVPIWISGGWGMIALAIDAVIIFVVGWSLTFRLAQFGAFAQPEPAWRKWNASPESARGPLSRIIRAAMASANPEAMQFYFESLHAAEFRPFSRDLKAMKVAVTAAPLLGLLGTVTGMLTTFQALSAGGGEKTMDMIARGISEALITTETGLVLALSGLIFQYSLTRLHDKLNKIVAHLETQCGQAFHHRLATAAPAA